MIMPANLANNPQYRTQVRIDGIFGGNSQGRIQEVVDMLKMGDQAILDVDIDSRNGYGKVLGATVVHTPNFPVNQQVLSAMKPTPISVDGIWGGNSCGRIDQTIQTLKDADQKIVNVEVTSYNGYGKILGANVWHISKYQYDAIMSAPTAAPAPAAKPAA